MFMFFKIALANLLLSSDNILMIALFGQDLAKKRRLFVLLWSMLASIALKLGLLFIVSFLFRITLLQSFFGLIICFMAFRLLGTEERDEHIDEAPSILGSVWKIVLANLMMSFENVATLISLTRGHVWIAWFGILVTAPLIFFGSHLLAKVLTKYDFIIYLGAVVLFKIGLDLVFKASVLINYAQVGPWILTGLFAVYTVFSYLQEKGIYLFRNRV